MSVATGTQWNPLCRSRDVQCALYIHYKLCRSRRLVTQHDNNVLFLPKQTINPQLYPSRACVTTRRTQTTYRNIYIDARIFTIQKIHIYHWASILCVCVCRVVGNAAITDVRSFFVAVSSRARAWMFIKLVHPIYVIYATRPPFAGLLYILLRERHTTYV